MKHLENEILRKHRIRLHSMDTKRILGMCESLKDQYNTEQIGSQKTEAQKAEKLLDILVKHGQRAFEEFINALDCTNPELSSPILEELISKQALDISSR